MMRWSNWSMASETVVYSKKSLCFTPGIHNWHVLLLLCLPICNWWPHQRLLFSSCAVNKAAIVVILPDPQQSVKKMDVSLLRASSTILANAAEPQFLFPAHVGLSKSSGFRRVRGVCIWSVAHNAKKSLWTEHSSRLSPKFGGKFQNVLQTLLWLRREFQNSPLI